MIEARDKNDVLIMLNLIPLLRVYLWIKHTTMTYNNCVGVIVLCDVEELRITVQGVFWALT